MRSASSIRQLLYLATAVGALNASSFCNSALAQETTTPIKHVIIIIGENRTFDNIYGTYKPKGNQSILNLLSQNIVKENGTPDKNYSLSMQYQVNTPYPSIYFIDAAAKNVAGKTAYQTTPGNPQSNPPFPPPNTSYVPTSPGGLSQGQGPFNSTVDVAKLEPSLEAADLFLLTTGASNLPMGSTDTRVVYDKNNAGQLSNGSVQITGGSLPYDSYTGDMVHRLFHMWQQSDCDIKNATSANPSGCLNDLYPFVGVARGDNSGGNSMGFYNMARGDAPLFKQLADTYTLNDNYHQPVMGRTAVQHQMLGTADDVYWSTSPLFPTPSQPPAAKIANPNPKSPTNAAFTVDGNWTNCSDSSQPGIAAIVTYLGTLPWHPSPNCDNHFYMINNMSPGFLPNGIVDTPNISAGNKVPPSSLRTIGDALNKQNIPWAYYGGGYDAAVRVANGSTDPYDRVAGGNYCDICNPFGYATSIMGDPAQRTAHIKDAIDFFNDLNGGTLPAVSYLKPDSLIDGHPASSKLDLFEGMVQKVLDGLQANPGLFAKPPFL